MPNVQYRPKRISVHLQTKFKQNHLQIQHKARKNRQKQRFAKFPADCTSAIYGQIRAQRSKNEAKPTSGSGDSLQRLSWLLQISVVET